MSAACPECGSAATDPDEVGECTGQWHILARGWVVPEQVEPPR